MFRPVAWSLSDHVSEEQAQYRDADDPAPEFLGCGSHGGKGCRIQLGSLRRLVGGFVVLPCNLDSVCSYSGCQFARFSWYWVGVR
jgi:hypothetical protein